MAEKKLYFIKKQGEGYYEEKKSKFIANIYPVKSEEEAGVLIEATRKKYWDARHNCYAFVIGDNNEVTRCSDDGEPSGTAGKPMLEVLLGRQLHDCLVIVTRYFGGTLLGTGGLVRAYQKASIDAIDNSIVAEKIMGSCLTITTDYNGVGKVQYMMAKENLEIKNIEYGSDVVIKVDIPADKVEATQKEVTEITSGRAKMEEEKNIEIIIERKME